MIKNFFTVKYFRENLLLTLCIIVILSAAIFIWDSHTIFEETIVNSFYEEQTIHTVLASNLLKNHIDESQKNLSYIINIFNDSESYASKKKVLDDFFKIYPTKFQSVSLLSPDGEVLATSGALIVGKNFFEYVSIEKREEFTKNLKPFISERIIRFDGYPSTFVFVPFLLPGEDPRPHYVSGELSLKSLVKDKMAYIKDKKIVFVMTDDDGEIYGIINVQHDDITDMENGNLFYITKKCIECHTEDSFASFKQVKLDEPNHSLFETPEGDLFYRTVARTKVFNEEWLFSISQPHARIQGQLAKNFRSNALVIVLLITSSILGAYAFYRVSRKEALESQYSDLVNRLDVGIVRLKDSGEIINMNRAMSSLLGYKLGENMKKLPIINFFVESTEWQSILALLNKTTSTVKYDSLLKKRGGTHFIASFSMNAHKNNSGEILHIDGVIQDITEKRHAEANLEETNQRLEILSTTDGLTKLANRRCLDELLLKEYDRHSRSGDKLSLILLDLDCFKTFNDSYGHIAGDKCLQRVAQVLDTCTSRPSDLAARYGGEEFVCLLPSTEISGAITVAEKIRCDIMTLAIPHKSSSVADYVTASLGVVSVQCSHDGSAKDILALADKLLYRAKASGRNRVESDI